MQFFAKDIMSTDLIAARPSMRCEEVMDLLVANHISGVPVINNEGVLVGVISMTDLLDATINLPYTPTYFQVVQLEEILERQGLHMESITEGFVSDFMHREVYTASPDSPLEDVAREMFKHQIHRIIIVDGETQKPVGIVTTFDLLKVMAQADSLESLMGQGL